MTVYVDRLTSPEYEENDFSGIVDMVEVIRIQDTGPTEAARAIRKKLKYGNTHRQLRALTILDGLIQNAGGRFQRTFADEPLLERLRMLPRDEMADEQVRKKCQLLFRQWAVAYKGTPGLAAIAQLHTQLPKRAEKRQERSKVLRETERQAQENPFGDDDDNEEDDDDPDPSGPSASQPRRPTLVEQVEARERSAKEQAQSRAQAQAQHSQAQQLDRSLIDKPKKSKKSKKSRSAGQRRPFDLEKEKPQITATIAQASIASTGLLNTLKLLNREAGQTPSTSPDAATRFETCKLLRRQVLRYIQHIESEQWIGSLLNANDELVKALMAFEVLEKGIDDDSDSEAEAAVAAAADHRRRSSAMNLEGHMAGLSVQGGGTTQQPVAEEVPPAKPPRPRGASLAAQAGAGQQMASTPLAALSGTGAGRHGPAARKQPESESDDDEPDENDPFGDQNEIN